MPLSRKTLNAVAGLATAVLVFSGGIPAGAVNPKYTAGVAAFNGKNFRAAVSAFSDVVRAEPRNVSAVYYLAMSYYSLGQVTAALGYFRWLSENYSGTAEGARAKTVLDQLGAQAAARGEELGSHPSGGASGGIVAPHAVPVSAKDAAFDPDSMISVLPNLGGRPAVQPEMVAGVKTALHSIPMNVLSFLSRSGCKIQVSPTPLDQNPDLINTQPRGWEPGTTFKNAPAYFAAPNVVVCNYAMDASDNWVPADDPLGALRHEIGHAIDRFLGHISQSEEFKLIYYKDCGKVDPDMKAKLHYFVQKAEGGPSEAFAECCATIFGERPYKQPVEEIKSSFPNCIAFIKARLAQL